MTGKVTTALCLLLLLAGCGEGDDGSRQEAIARETAAKEADAVRNALVADRRAVVEELQAGAPNAERRAALEAEEKRLSDEIRKANKERLRRDREDTRRQISEQRRGGK